MDQVELTTRDFLVHPRELVGVVRGVAEQSARQHMKMLGEIAAYWESGRVLLLVIGVVILACDLWILGEGLQIFARSEKERVS